MIFDPKVHSPSLTEKQTKLTREGLQNMYLVLLKTAKVTGNKQKTSEKLSWTRGS
jgi:hypothetical protein